MGERTGGPQIGRSVAGTALNRDLDRLAAAAPEAIAKLAGQADSGSLPTRAGRVDLANRKLLAELSILEKRLAAVEERLRAGTGSADRYQ